MAGEPFNVFSHRIDPRGVIAAVRSMADEVHVEGPEDDWTKIIVSGPKRLLRKRAQLVVSHDSRFYNCDDWHKYILGMSNYVAGFPDAPRKQEILRMIVGFRFILAFPNADISIPSGDERSRWVLAICQQLAGVVFSPSTLLDACGRVLISASGQYDPEAIVPVFATRQDSVGEADAHSADDSEEVVEAPSAQRIARRAMVLAAVGNRGLIEHSPRESKSPADDCKAILKWIDQLGLGDELEPDEWSVLQRPVGRLDAQATINAVWRLEGLAVLLWSLGLYELPPYDQLVTPKDLFDAVEIFNAPAARQLIAAATLRPADELAAYRNHATMTNWRFRNFRLRPVAVDFVKMSQGCWIGTFDIYQFRIAKNDVLVGNRAISEADSETVGMCESIASERHKAINWIVEGGRLYSETDTST